MKSCHLERNHSEIDCIRAYSRFLDIFESLYYKGLTGCYDGHKIIGEEH